MFWNRKMSFSPILSPLTELPFYIINFSEWKKSDSHFKNCVYTSVFSLQSITVYLICIVFSEKDNSWHFRDWFHIDKLLERGKAALQPSGCFTLLEVSRESTLALGRNSWQTLRKHFHLVQDHLFGFCSAVICSQHNINFHALQIRAEWKICLFSKYQILVSCHHATSVHVMLY